MKCLICNDTNMHETSKKYCDRCYKLLRNSGTYISKSKDGFNTTNKDTARTVRTAKRQLNDKLFDLSVLFMKYCGFTIPKHIPDAIANAVIDYDARFSKERVTIKTKHLIQEHYVQGVVGTYKNIAEAAQKTGISRNSISRCLNGHQNSAGHCQWRWEYDMVQK